MIKCTECGHTADKFSIICPKCEKKHTLSRFDIQDAIEEARAAMKKRDFEYALEIYEALANEGVTEAEREYGSLLEDGKLVTRDLDRAMSYFFEAAKKNDPYSAYRYSRLAARTSDRASDFWLTYSALLGCKEAFTPTAEHYSDMGDEESAGYYYSLAAHGDLTDAIVTMAKRYYSGIGCEKSEPYAKWYLDKFTLPPLHALKLAYKLRSVKAELPPEPRFTSKSRILRGLIRDAKKYSLKEAHLFLAELLAKEGSADAIYSLGVLYAEGDVCEVRAEDAIRLLEIAMEKGSRESAKYLGDVYTVGKLVPRNIDRALSYYEKAADLGEGSAYEIMGDMFYEGRLVDINIAYAIEIYELGAREGDASCREKAEKLHAEREGLYKEAKSSERTNPECALESYGISAAMGYLPAHKELARCFECGIGTKKNRKMAFIWYGLAVDGGDTDALYDLGRCYSRGIGTHYNFDMALEILTKAKRYGSSAADGELSRILENKKRGMIRSLFSNGIRLIYKKKFEEAFELLSACAEVGYPEGSYVLGCLYEFGLGTVTSRTKAFECYNAAFDTGFRDPRQAYKLKILKMAR
ncbi:MAG: sel1 repeat family protein [Clostridia bacterium]|nr:sel1 repeat family protein [Clostridia bacterium]